MTDLRPVGTPTPRQEAARTLNELRAAMDAHGITLPSLGLDTASLVSTTVRPLVELGRVNLETARKLIQALSTRDPQ